MSLKKNKVLVLIGMLVLLTLGLVTFYYFKISASDIDIKYTNSKNDTILNAPKTSILTETKIIEHISTPEAVKAVYISGWIGGVHKARERIIKMIDSTELNAIVIDVKDSTGRVSFNIENPVIKDTGSIEKRIGDIDVLIKELHSKNIYVIGRIAVFQDPYLAKAKPEWAITKKSDGKVWKDNKGLAFLDPTKKEVWNYIETLAKESYAIGFDELNFDYIRYPSDGNIKDMNYHIEEGKNRSDNIEAFFVHLNKEVKKENNIPISADLFGLTTETSNDMGIGQIWEKALPHFDFLSPMVYPSHYPPGQAGFKNPAEHPYEIVNIALGGAVKKTVAVGQDVNKIRPWLQDFDMGAKYTDVMIKDQIKATYNNKIQSWMLWDPKNVYTESALEITQ